MGLSLMGMLSRMVPCCLLASSMHAVILSILLQIQHLPRLPLLRRPRATTMTNWKDDVRKQETRGAKKHPAPEQQGLTTISILVMSLMGEMHWGEWRCGKSQQWWRAMVLGMQVSSKYATFLWADSDGGQVGAKTLGVPVPLLHLVCKTNRKIVRWCSHQFNKQHAQFPKNHWWRQYQFRHGTEAAKHICSNLRSSLKEKTITMALLTKVWIRSGLFEVMPCKVLQRKHGDNRKK